MNLLSLTTPLRHLAAGLLIAILFMGCGGRTAATLEAFDRPIHTPQYATGFEIVGADGQQSTLLRSKNPWQGAQGVETTLFVARNGEQAPAGFDGPVVEAGARRIVCMSSTYVAMLDALGVADRIVGVSGLDNITNAYVTTHRDQIGDVGYDGNIDYELLVALRPDLVLLYGVNGASPMETKLRELRIPYAYISDYLEESPLGKAEWLVAVAEVLDLRTEGGQLFEAIPARYEALRHRAAAATTPRPRVMINTPYGDSWFMASHSSYVARLIADAGGEYIYTDNASNRSLPIDLEKAYLLASEADVWINVGSYASLDELRRRLPKFADVPCVRHGTVYNSDRRTNPTGGNDYWESGVIRPDIVLQDLIGIFHPEVLDTPTPELYYYRRLE